MKRAYVVRRRSRLEPANRMNEESIWEMPEGELIEIRWKRPRNIDFHNKFFSMLRTAFSMQSDFDSFEVFRSYILSKVGFARVVLTPDGAMIIEPESISFANMDEDRFEEVYSSVLDVLLKLYGIKKEDVERLMQYA